MSVQLSEPVPADPERDAILETVRRFTEEHVVPVTAELDVLADPMACFSWEIVEAADAIGLRTMASGRGVRRHRRRQSDNGDGHRGALQG